MIIVGIVIAVLTVFYLSLKSSGDGGVVESKSFFFFVSYLSHVVALPRPCLTIRSEFDRLGRTVCPNHLGTILPHF